MATQSMRHGNRRTSSLFLVAIIVIAAVVTFATYAASSGSSTLIITPPDTASGAKADVLSISTPFESVLGQAKKTKGVVLSKLKFGTGINSAGTRIEILWTDPGQATGVLLNPNAFLETRLYFIDSSCAESDRRTFTDPELGSVTVCPDFSATVENFTAMSMSGTYAHFTVTQPNKSVIYILADITVPGGAPAGQQSSLTELTFIIGVS